MRGRHYARYGAAWPDADVIEGSEGDDSTTVADGNDGGMRGYAGGGMGRGGAGRRRSYFESLDTRPRSAPAMAMPRTGYASGMHYTPGATPRIGGGGNTDGLNNVQAGGGGMMATGVPMMRGGGIAEMQQQQQQQAPPPEYTSNPNLPRYGVAGGEMHGAQMHPYASYPGPRPPSPTSSTSIPAPQSQAPPQASRQARPDHYEHVPMGAYADAKKARKPARPRKEPRTSTRLNRGHPLHKKARPSGEEWLQGDAFLDACTCSTNCNCRESQRVLYRARNDRRIGRDDSDDDEEQHGYGSGEIRYILKEDLGRDCGDHSGCKKRDSESDSDSSCKKKMKKEKRKKKRRTENKEEKKRKDEFEGFKDDLLEALDERLQDMTKASRQRDQSGSPARPSLGLPGLGQTSYNLMNGSGIDPQIMAQQLGVMGGNPHGMATTPGMGLMPPGMTGPSGNGSMHHHHPPPDMSMSMAGFPDDVSDKNGPRGMGMGMGMGNANMQHGMMNKKAMRPNFMLPRGANAGGRFGGDGMGMDMDRMAAMHFQAMGSCGGIPGQRGSGGGRRAHLDSESDDSDFGPGLPICSGIRQRAGLERNGEYCHHVVVTTIVY